MRTQLDDINDEIRQLEKNQIDLYKQWKQNEDKISELKSIKINIQ
tara:strand:- start:128 stop:262 length:135 start_codon:yes stop_codon:yes gene_type:complete